MALTGKNGFYALAVLAMTACAKPSPVSRQQATVSAPTAAAEAAPAKKPRFGEAAVYVDGVAVGVVRAAELPPSLQPLSGKEFDDGSKVYALKDYVKALGVDIAKVRGVQIYGGQRVGAMSGDEFRRVGGSIRFAFTSNEHGKPGLLWPHHHVAITTMVGTLTSMTIYVDKEPPTVTRDGALAYPDGTLVNGVPYAPAEQGKGTRVYVDGKLAGVVKRRALSNALVVGDDLAHPKFSMTAYLSSIGVHPESAKAIDFIASDDMFLRVDATQTEKAKSLTFTIPAHSQGQIAMPRPTADGATSAPIKVDAVQVFVNSAPPSRAISVPSAEASGGGGGGGGGGNNAGEPEDTALE